MATPHKCPVCDGTGLVSRPPGMPGDVDSWPAASAEPHPCRACAGSGIVWDQGMPEPTVEWPAGTIVAAPPQPGTCWILYQ